MMSDLWDITISKNNQILSQLTWINFWRLNFQKKNNVTKLIFSQNSQKNFGKQIRKILKKTFSKKFSKKIKCGKRNYFVRFLIIIFQIMISSNIDQWQFRYDYIWVTSKAHNSDVYQTNETSNSFKW